jgi:hypothetical protein
MSYRNPVVDKVERLLRESGVETSPTRGKRRRPPSGPLRRFWRKLRNLFLLLLLCAMLALAGLGYWSTGTVTDPVNPPNALGRLPWTPAVDPRIGIEEAFRAPSQAATVPIGWERIPFFWSNLQQDGPASWNAFATNHDKQIDREIALGRHLVGLLINTPGWAATQPSLHGASPPKGLYLPYDDPGNYWGHFVGLIAKRYAGRIDDWIIWNEVNIPSGHWKTWGGSHADYAQLLKVAYLAAKAANPNARIILAGDPYWYDHGAFFEDLLHLLASDPTARAHEYYFDAANLHLYSRPTDMVTVVTWYRDAMRKAGIEKPIWISETNAAPYDDTVRLSARGGFRATLDDQASFIIQAFALDLALGVQRIEVNRMIDGSDFKAGGAPLGLVRNDGTVRPAFDAYRTAATIFAGATGGTIAENKSTGVYTVTLHRPGYDITVLWDQKPVADIVKMPVSPQAQCYDKFGEQCSASIVKVVKGMAEVHLEGATGNTNSADPNDYVIGGNPVIVVDRA